MRNVRERIEENEEIENVLDKTPKTKLKRIGTHVLIPFTNKEDLPKYDDKGKIEKHPDRYFVNGNATIGYKLIQVYRNRKNNIKQGLVKTLKPHIKKRSQDRELIKVIKAAGIPGIF